MERLSSIGDLLVSQQKEWGEILTGFETKNRYAISDVSGSRLYLSAEEAGSTLLRWFLKALRPFTIAVVTENDQVVLRVRCNVSGRMGCQQAQVAAAWGRRG